MLDGFEEFAQKNGLDTTKIGHAYANAKTAAAFIGYEAGSRMMKEKIHDKICDAFKTYGVGDGSRGWIEHSDHDNEPLRRDQLSIDGELIFGIEAVIEKWKVGANNTALVGRT